MKLVLDAIDEQLAQLLDSILHVEERAVFVPASGFNAFLLILVAPHRYRLISNRIEVVFLVIGGRIIPMIKLVRQR